MQVPPGKQPWQRLVLMSRHEGLLPASPPLKSLPLAAAQGTQGLFLWAGAARDHLSLAEDSGHCSRGLMSCLHHQCHRRMMSRTLRLALLALAFTVDMSWASGFTGEGSRGKFGEGAS